MKEGRLVDIAYEILIDKLDYLKAFQEVEYGACEGWFQGELFLGLRNRGIPVTRKGIMRHDCDLIINSQRVELKGRATPSSQVKRVLVNPFREHKRADLVMFLLCIDKKIREWLKVQPQFIFRDLAGEWIVGVALKGEYKSVGEYSRVR